MSAELLQPALTELPALLTEADLHIAQLSLTVLSSVCHLTQPAAALTQSGFMVTVSTIQYNTIQCIQYHVLTQPAAALTQSGFMVTVSTIQYNTIQYIQYHVLTQPAAALTQSGFMVTVSTIQYNTIQYIQYHVLTQPAAALTQSGFMVKVRLTATGRCCRRDRCWRDG